MYKVLYFYLLLSVNIFSQKSIEKIVNFSQSPMASFQKNCSRCHGEEGSAYGKEFAQLEDNQLSRVVSDMMFGPAFMNPDQAEIDAMTAYNKALRDNKPFAIVLNAENFLYDKDEKLILEVSPGASLRLNNEDVEIEKQRTKWKLSYNKNVIKHLEIIVEKNGKISSLNFPHQLFSG